MRRPAAAVLGTIAGAALLVGAKLGARQPADLASDAANPGDDRVASSPLASGPPTSPPSSEHTETATAAPESSKRPKPESSSSPTTPEPTQESGLRDGTFDGDAVTHKYGTLQLTINVDDGTITDVTADYSTEIRVSEEINAEALPELRQEALKVQSAEIDTVSGATYTSDAYRSSLQSALDEAEG